MTKGEKIVYMCLAGIRYDAVVRFVRPDGRVDIASDVGCIAWHELSKIEVREPVDLKPGTCARVIDGKAGGRNSASSKNLAAR